MKSKNKMRASRFQTLDTTDSESVPMKDQNKVYETLFTQSGQNIFQFLKPKYTFDTQFKQQKKRNNSFTVRKVQYSRQKYQHLKFTQLFQNDFINTKLIIKQNEFETNILNHSQKILDKYRLPKLNLAKMNNILLNFQEAAQQKIKTIDRTRTFLKSNTKMYSHESSPRGYYQRKQLFQIKSL